MKANIADFILAVNSIRTGLSFSQLPENILKYITDYISEEEFVNLCRSDYPENVVADLCIGWSQTKKKLTNQGLIYLINILINKKYAGESESILLHELFVSNCKHPGKTDLLYHPDLIVPGKAELSPMEIAELSLGQDFPDGIDAT